MNIESTKADIKSFLAETFEAVDKWFDKSDGLRTYQPTKGGWTINEILEHIGLTNHFLLILIDKGTNKALQNVHKLDLQTELGNYSFHWNELKEVGQHKAFQWIRPEHMHPTGKKPLNEVRIQLKEQVNHCLENLDKLKNGEGILYKTTMTVNNLGKLDVYEYIYFLAQHGHRHLMQMEKNEAEFTSLIK